jgi:hypothetical protein
MGQWPVVLHGIRSSFSGRVCAVRKSKLAIRLAHRRWHRRSSKKQMRTRPETLEFAKYVLVFTTRSIASAEEILQLYRMPWQIDLAFKPLKSLAQLGYLPKHNEPSSRAWLYGKLLVSLLVQKVICIGRDICPSGQGLADSEEYLQLSGSSAASTWDMPSSLVARPCENGHFGRRN